MTDTAQACGNDKVPITTECLACNGKGCSKCDQRGWLFIPLGYPGGTIKIVSS